MTVVPAHLAGGGHEVDRRRPLAHGAVLDLRIVGALFMGKPSLKLWQSDRQVVSLEAKPSQTVPMQRVAGEQPKVQGL